jgi:hypothetical protein
MKKKIKECGIHLSQKMTKKREKELRNRKINLRSKYLSVIIIRSPA